MNTLARYALFVFTLSAISFSTYARDPVQVIEHIDVPVMTSTGKPITIEQVKDAISTAATSREWSVSISPSQNLLSATLLVRGKHTVVVSIPYSIEKYSLLYQNSTNMKYGLARDIKRATNLQVSTGFTHNLPPSAQLSDDTKVIHPNYNVWVSELLQAIKAELKRL